MDNLINEKIKELWLDVPDSIFNQLLDYCIPGKHFYYIFDVDILDYLWTSDSITEILGYNKNNVKLLLTLESIHPDDLLWFIAIEKEIDTLAKTKGHEWLSQYKIMYDCRFRHKSGKYIRLLRQMIQIRDENTQKDMRYGIVTDISHIKEVGNPCLSFVSLVNDDESLLNVPLEILPQKDSPFTKREKEIVSLIIQGFVSKDIANKLFISLNTVKNHKKNIFTKANCNTVTQLFKKCITCGWTEFYLKPSR